MEKQLFYSLNKSLNTKSKRVALSDICRVHGADSMPLLKVFIPIEKTAVLISAFAVSKKLMEIYPGYTLNNTGPSECIISCAAKKQSKAIVIIKAVFLSLIMFVGGAFTIITFHEDVSMRCVQSDIYKFFTGIEADTVPVVSVPYSFGIAIGFILLFGLFSRKNKSPSVLDLDIYAQDKTLKEYISTTQEEADG